MSYKWGQTETQSQSSNSECIRGWLHHIESECENLGRVESKSQGSNKLGHVCKDGESVQHSTGNQVMSSDPQSQLLLLATIN